MLDALKTLAGGGKAAQKQAEELEALIAAAREERTALSAMLLRSPMAVTRRTRAFWFAIASSPLRSRGSSSAARSGRRSARMISRFASAAAQATGCPA